MKKFLLLLAVGLIVLTGCTIPKKVKNLTIAEAQAKAVKFIEENMVQPGTKISVKETKDDGTLYKIVINLPNGQDYTSYISKDGTKFFPQGVDLTTFEKDKQDKAAKDAAAQQKALAEMPKKDKPLVELYVMSFCPYGVQAEQIMKPVADLLGTKADFNIRFIVSLDGTDLNKVQSLHGTTEGLEDARQLCVAKNYDNKKLWDYVSRINDKCYPEYRKGDDVYKKCWQQAAKDAGLDSKKLDACMIKDGASLIQAESKASDAAGVTGSPTIIINGAKYNGDRSADAIKSAVCSAFTKAPAECSKSLGGANDAPAAQGGCAQ